MIHASAGEALTFEVSNEGTAPHTFAIDTGERVQATAEIPPGEGATLEVSALEAGTYETFCTIPGHKEAGMVGSLMVQQSVVASAGTTGSMGVTGGTVSTEEMLDGQEAGVAAFPEETEGQGNQPLEPRNQTGVKVFDLTATEVRWETSPGVFVDAMEYNGTVPGPEIRVHQRRSAARQRRDGHPARGVHPALDVVLHMLASHVYSSPTSRSLRDALSGLLVDRVGDSPRFAARRFLNRTLDSSTGRVPPAEMAVVWPTGQHQGFGPCRPS